MRELIIVIGFMSANFSRYPQRRNAIVTCEKIGEKRVFDRGIRFARGDWDLETHGRAQIAWRSVGSALVITDAPPFSPED